MKDEFIKKTLLSKKVQIVGDSGRGKTTLATALSKKLNIPIYSTDDFFWKVKFTEPNNQEESVKEIKKIYEKSKWLVEGSTTRLISPGLGDSDLIINLEFRNLFQQYISIISRSSGRENENSLGLIKFLIYITRKRYGIGYKKGILKQKKFLEMYKDKIVTIDSFSKIDRFIDDLNKEL